ncbi:hypothetical protein [Lentimicrobium sp. S6]|uniref:hypothetical protein n=1 Tax=Lentimicrobium sp. S6 TaxID=2735872 RepID=UPI00155425B1|nr:hypothetical protein [Lentimicrobium sp. S6]NPD48018.1 hypothetical protein [Lentimicrobium sp. S6]
MKYKSEVSSTRIVPKAEIEDRLCITPSKRRSLEKACMPELESHGYNKYDKGMNEFCISILRLRLEMEKNVEEEILSIPKWKFAKVLGISMDQFRDLLHKNEYIFSKLVERKYSKFQKKLVGKQVEFLMQHFDIDSI